MNSKLVSVSVVALMGLSGCLGGTDGTSTSTSSTGGTPPVVYGVVIDPDGTSVISGTAITATFTGSSFSDHSEPPMIIAPTDFSGVSQITVTSVGGVPVALTIETNGETVSFSEAAGDTITIGDDNFWVRRADTSEDMALIDNNDSGFDHQSFGVWATGLGTATGGSVGAGSYGNKTTTMPVPPAVDATYTGKAVGIYGSPKLAGGYVESDVELTTDFTIFEFKTINSVFKGLDEDIQGATDANLTVAGDVTGSGFTSNSISSVTFNSGTVSGSFYGPNAEEVGGTFQVYGLESRSYIGSFGAKQTP